MAHKFFLKPIVTIPVAPIITGIILHDLVVGIILHDLVVVVVTDFNHTSVHLSTGKPSPIPDGLWD